MGALYTTQESGAMSAHTPEPNDDANFDARSYNSFLEEEKTTVDTLPLETRMKFKTPTPDGEFITIQLDHNPTKIDKIGANLPTTIEVSLMKCLKANADIFACTPKEMP
ncbi:hypothetical protein A2U01_0055251, partial [Trifolium medium]|nr:hypothetical protein [Trifolium medium]